MVNPPDQGLVPILVLKYDGTPQEFQQAAARYAEETTVRILAPGELLTIPSRQPVH